MDIISFNEAATANGRIESFIENPDSTSGVLTVPKVIAAGETITIPAGRVAILPDLQVDGDLVVDGDLFIPTGSMTSKVVQKVASTDNAVVRFDGVTGQVQNSGVIIDDSNNVGIGTTPSVWRTNYKAMTLHNYGSLYNGSGNYGMLMNGIFDASGSFKYSVSDYASMYKQLSGSHQWFTAPSGIAGNAITWTNAMTLDSGGNLLLMSGTGGLGYGAGAGGTVTQLTSKGTTVTLNKPTGRIIMSNAALASNSAVTFQFFNSLVSTTDNILIHLREYGGNTEPYIVTATTFNAGGGAYITLINRGATTLSEAVQLEYSIIKGAIA